MDQIAIGAEEALKQKSKEITEDLATSSEGLSSSEAEERLERYGPNEIREKQVSPVLKFLSYFWGPIPWMIEAAAILSAVVRHWEDFTIIAVLLLLNAAVGFWQEYKADNAIAQLKKRLALNARVVRDGKWQKIPARELVPGDLVRIRLGDIVPADVKLLRGDWLEADESALTGESMPVEKHEQDVAYSGSVVSRGEMDALVTATGMDTYFGKTAKLVESAQTRSHFQKTIVKIGDYLIALALVLVAVICIVAAFRHESWLTTLQFALILTVAAIPAALPAVLSVTLAVGASRLAKKKAIVSRLVAIEEMAGMDILCSDKTGTITENRLTVSKILPLADFTEKDVLKYAALASRAENQDPIDTAVLEKLSEDEDTENETGACSVSDFKPFDPVTKRTEATVVDSSRRRFQVAKGAPQAVLEKLGNPGDLEDRVNEMVDDLAENGYRALGVGQCDENGNWRYVGLLGLQDPPRKDSAETIKTAKNMNVKVKMVTGDHKAIAKSVARQVGLGQNIMAADQIEKAGDGRALEILENADGFAQVFPEHKYDIVEKLQKADHIVGMTGDGVNDAPALKKADVGVAVAGATDAARSSADIVLTQPGLSVIVDAIKESREIFQRMNSYAIYRIAETIRILFFITISILVFNFYPVTAVMIILLALLNDAPIMAIAYDNVRYSDHPERWDMRIVLGMATFLGLVGVAASFGLLYIGKHVFGLGMEAIQSLIFLKLAVAGHFTIFLARVRGPFWSNAPGKALFWSAVGTKILATLLVIYGWYVAPVGWKLALFVWGYSLAAFVATDLVKLLVYRLLDHTGLKFKR